MAEYLRNRPFMVITYTRVPVEGSKTGVKGWALDADAAWDANENMVIVDRIADKHLTGSDIIIDLIKSKIVKNRHGGSDETVVKGFVERYYSEVKTAMTRWIAQGGSMETMRELAGLPPENTEDTKEEE